MPTALPVVELRLAAVWTDVSGDLRATEPIVSDRGIDGNGPADRVAKIGTLLFALDNSTANTPQLAGYYSPGHANARAGFTKSIGTRYQIVDQDTARTITTSSVANPSVITTGTAHGLVTGQYVFISGHTGSVPAVNGRHPVTVLTSTTFSIPVNVTTGGTGGTVRRCYPRFTGTLRRITPTPGRDDARITFCEARDLIHDLGVTPVRGLAVQTNVRADQALPSLLALLPTPPPTAIEKASDTLPYVFDTARDETVRLLGEVQKLTLSEWGYCFPLGDGTLVWESRRKRGKTVSSAQSFDNVTTLLDGTGLDADRTFNRVEVTVQPRRVDLSPTSVLFSLQHPVRIGPQETITIRGLFVDPTGRANRVGGLDLQPLVAGTDYSFTLNSDGTGDNLTTSLFVGVASDGNSTEFTITNAGIVAGYLTKLKILGKAVHHYEAVIVEARDDVLIDQDGENPLRFTMPYQADPAVGLAAARYAIAVWKNETTGAERVSFVAQYSTDFMSAALNREISDRITLVDAQTGLNRAFFINGVRDEISPEGLWTVTYTLAPVDKNEYWYLGVVGKSELGLTTRLGWGFFQGHTDTPHLDSAHQDVAHTDVAHSDVAHDDSAHSDTAHSDTAHSDTAHSDVAHDDVAHDDQAHQDQAHQDQAHGDDGHGDHSDHTDHQDFVHVDQTNHGDVAHNDVAHQDAAHQDAAHVDTAHSDTAHDDVAHSDTAHSDTAHSDSAHSDTAHQDAAHQDVAHQDTPHEDQAHGDQFE